MKLIATPLAVLCAAVLSMPAYAAKPAKAPKAPKAPTFDTKRLSEEVKTLSSDEFQGRGPATEGETKTIDYLIAQFKAAGVQPGGDQRSCTAAATDTPSPASAFSLPRLAGSA